MAGYDGDVAVLTVIIGQDALMTDATAYVERYNVTWPVLLDSAGDFAASLPTGEADAVVVVDRAGRVSSAASPTQAYTELGEAMTASQRGGSQSASTYLRLAFGLASSCSSLPCLGSVGKSRRSRCHRERCGGASSCPQARVWPW